MPQRNPFHFKKISNLQKLKSRAKYFNNYAKRRLTPELSKDQAGLLETLKEDGSIILEEYLDDKTLEMMQSELQSNLEQLKFETPALAQTRIDEIRHKPLIDNHMLGSKTELASLGVTFDSHEASSYQQVLEDFNPSTLTVPMLKYSDTFRKVWTDPYLLGIIASYLGLIPQLVEAYVRRNFPAPHKTMNHFWHRDLNNKTHLLKMFVFLSDCTLKTGPHQFILGSHRDYSKLNGERYFTDKQVDSAYPNKSQHLVSTVKAGTVVIEDTRGLHRACLPEEGYRDLGFAVFMPLRPFYPHQNYAFPQQAFKELNPFQKTFIPKSCLR